MESAVETETENYFGGKRCDRLCSIPADVDPDLCILWQDQGDRKITGPRMRDKRWDKEQIGVKHMENIIIREAATDDAEEMIAFRRNMMQQTVWFWSPWQKGIS